MEEFTALNPGNNRPVILQDHAEVLLLPVDKVEKFRSNLEKNNQRLVSWRAHQTKKGESFAAVAARFDMPLEELRAANGLSKFAVTSNGQTLLVPASEDELDDGFTPFNMHDTAVAEMSGFSYVVRKGDTVSSIAHRFHINQKTLISMNQGDRKLHVGQRLSIIAAGGPLRRKLHAKRGTSRRVKVASSSR
jgi:membrane-bound lytic murein transglycosylase D